MPKVSHEDVQTFRDHCVYVRSVYRFAERLFKDADADEQALMDSTAPLFFEDLCKVFTEFVVLAACRITDPEKAGGNKNFMAEMLVNGFVEVPETFDNMNKLHAQMLDFRKKIVGARNKLGAHADLDAVRKGQPIAAASFEDWNRFWSTLGEFVSLLNETTIGVPFDVDAGGVLGDAEVAQGARAKPTF